MANPKIITPPNPALRFTYAQLDGPHKEIADRMAALLVSLKEIQNIAVAPEDRDTVSGWLKGIVPTSEQVQAYSPDLKAKYKSLCEQGWIPPSVQERVNGLVEMRDTYAWRGKVLDTVADGIGTAAWVGGNLISAAWDIATTNPLTTTKLAAESIVDGVSAVRSAAAEGLQGLRRKIMGGLNQTEAREIGTYAASVLQSRMRDRTINSDSVGGFFAGLVKDDFSTFSKAGTAYARDQWGINGLLWVADALAKLIEAFGFPEAGGNVRSFSARTLGEPKSGVMADYLQRNAGPSDASALVEAGKSLGVKHGVNLGDVFNLMANGGTVLSKAGPVVVPPVIAAPAAGAAQSTPTPPPAAGATPPTRGASTPAPTGAASTQPAPACSPTPTSEALANDPLFRDTVALLEHRQLRAFLPEPITPDLKALIATSQKMFAAQKTPVVNIPLLKGDAGYREKQLAEATAAFHTAYQDVLAKPGALAAARKELAGILNAQLKQLPLPCAPAEEPKVQSSLPDPGIKAAAIDTTMRAREAAAQVGLGETGTSGGVFPAGADAAEIRAIFAGMGNKTPAIPTLL